MAIVQSLFEAINLVFSWPIIGWALLGLAIGIFVGALPGIGASIAMAVALPLTTVLDSTSAILLLVGIYVGGMYGGCVSAILLNTPGTAGAAATTLDGYPMSRQGLAIKALAISATASALGGIMAIILLFILTPFLIEIVLLFQSVDFFLLAVLGLGMITMVSKGSMAKGIAAGMFGLLLTTIGIAPASADLRYTFDSLALFDGVSYIAGLIGLFAISEIIHLASEEGGIAQKTSDQSREVISGVMSVIKNRVTFVKSAIIGMAIGAVPGAGASVANFISYAEAARSSTDGKFGEGDERGVIASEASDNASVAGALIPTISFGIPGSGGTALLLGALILHGMTPGPQMFSESLSMTYSIYIVVLVSNVLILVIGLSLADKIGHITRVNTHLIIPFVIVLALLGGFVLRANWVDVLTIFLLGILGYYMRKYNYSIIAFVLGLVLGPLAEENLIRSMQISNGSMDIFFTKPLTIVLLILTVVVYLGPLGKSLGELVRSQA